MTFAGSPPPTPDDSPEARRYNRIHRWLGIADFVIGSAFLVLLLITGWTGWLRDLALRRGFQNYTLAVFLYLFFLLLISKALGLRPRLLRIPAGAKVSTLHAKGSLMALG